MNVSAKKPFTQAPRMNVLKDQLKEQRFGLIIKVKALREQRQALKGVKGSGQQWAELSAQIDELQAKIDMLSKSLGLPVKDRDVLNAALKLEGTRSPGSSPRLHVYGKTAKEAVKQSKLNPEVSVGSYLAPTKPAPMIKGDLNHRQDNATEMVMDDEDHVIWDRLDESLNGNK